MHVHIRPEQQLKAKQGPPNLTTTTTKFDNHLLKEVEIVHLLN